MLKINPIAKISLTFALSLNQLGMISIPEMVFAQPTANQNIEQTLANYNQIIHVDSRRGNDLTGKGNSAEPFKSITQALMIAKTKTIIKLAPGTYNVDSGEQFPLTLRQDVIIQGDLSSRGRTTIIEGSGFFVSPTAAGQNATIVVTHQGAGVVGITVTNPTNRGHGIWIESSKPLISYNTITRNGNTGISVNGKATPTITHNYFFNNDGNGLLVYGTSATVVENNDFERTGFGVSGVQSATMVLRNNTFKYNRIGVMLEGNSQAVLRQNQITDNTEAGLMTIAQASADLGTKQNPGQNIFRGNAQSDIKNSSANQVITAFGNQLSSKTAGNIDLNADTSNIRIAQNNLTPSSLSQTPLSGGMIEITAPTITRGNGSQSNPPSQTPLGGRMIEITAPTITRGNGSQSNPSSQTPLGGRMIEITAPQSTNNPVSVENNYNYGHSSSTLNNNPLTGNDNSYSLSHLNIPPLPTKIPPTETIVISGNLTPRHSIASGNGVTSSTKLPPPPPLSEPYRQPQTNSDIASNSNEVFLAESSNQNKSIIESDNPYNNSDNEELQQSSPPPTTNTSRSLPYSRETNPPSTIEPSVTSTPSFPPPITTSPNTSNSSTVRRTLGDTLLTINGANSSVPSQPTNQPTSNNTPVSFNPPPRALRYKIVVETKNSTQESQVRSLYPDSFRTTHNGKAMLQVGIFSSQEKAQQVIQSLKQVGLNPLVIH